MEYLVYRTNRRQEREHQDGKGTDWQMWRTRVHGSHGRVCVWCMKREERGPEWRRNSSEDVVDTGVEERRGHPETGQSGRCGVYQEQKRGEGIRMETDT